MHILHRYWKTIVVAACILYASIVRTPHLTLPPISYSDKWAHIAMYLLFGAVWMWELNNNTPSKKRIFLGWICPILYGGLMEILQEQFFYPRTGDWKDWIADIIGTTAGIALACGIWKMK